MIAATNLLNGLSNPRNPPWLPSSLRPRQAPHPSTKNLRDQIPPSQAGPPPPPWALSGPSWTQGSPPPTQRPGTSPTWSNWASTSASVSTNTPSARATTEKSSSDLFWNSCYSLGTISSPPVPQSITFSMPHRSYSPWTTRRMLSEVRPSITSDQSPCQPVQFERASTYSSACENTDAPPPPQPETILPLRGSAWSAPQTSSLFSGLRPVEWARPDSDFPPTTLGHTLSVLEEPWTCASRGSQIRPPRPSDGGAC